MFSPDALETAFALTGHPALLSLGGLSERASDCSPSCLPAAWAPHKARIPYPISAPSPMARPSHVPSITTLFLRTFHLPKQTRSPLETLTSSQPQPPGKHGTLKEFCFVIKLLHAPAPHPRGKHQQDRFGGWGVGVGYREQEGGRQGNASIWKEPPEAPAQGRAGLLRAGGLTPSRGTPSSPGRAGPGWGGQEAR